MKLRLETGNFSIKALIRNPDTTGDAELITTTLPKGLSYMDFIGTVVDYGVSAEVITLAVDHPFFDDYVTLVSSLGSNTIYYNKATGELSFSVPVDPVNPVPVDPGDDSGDSGNDPVDPGNGGDDSGDSGDAGK